MASDRALHLRHTNGAIAKYKIMKERATTGVDFQQATENQALLVFEPPAKCHYSKTREQRYRS